jgi:FkbM family methyltransferase
MDDFFKISGEHWMLERLSSCSMSTVFDAGSNVGGWTKLAKSFIKEANFHTFELSSDTFKKMLNNEVLDDRVIPNSFGLAESIKELVFKYCPDANYLNTALAEMLPGTQSNIHYEWNKGLVVTGDFYMESRKIDYVDLLKIDVEGLENLVLQGFNNSLNNKKIGCIQFEFGMANIISKWLLIDYYKLLSPLGFKIAKLDNSGKLDFKDYNLTMEDFNIPNYVAVHESRQDILNVLSQ